MKRVSVALAALAAVATSVVVAENSAGASTFEVVGWAGGTMVRAANSTVTSALTAASSIEGPSIGVADTESVAAASVPNLLTTGGIETSTASTAIPNGVQVTSHVKTTGVNLLGGTIKIDAVDTTAVARYVGGLVSSDTSTKFVGIHIVGAKVPSTIPRNYNANLPGVAHVVLNGSFTATAGSNVMTEGAGLYLSLLKSRGANAVGTEVYLNPTYSAVGLVNPTQSTKLSGYAFGTQVHSNAGLLLNVRSDKTAPITLPAGGTNPKFSANNMAAVSLNPALRIGAIQTTATGTNTPAVADARTSADIAGVNLFDGLITAAGITAVAHVHRASGAPIATEPSTTFDNLTIAGKAIPNDVSPNTVITVLNLGTVTINAQRSTANATQVRGLDITLSTAAYGLPAGAEVEIGVAAAGIS